MLLLQTCEKQKEAEASCWSNSEDPSKIGKWRGHHNFVGSYLNWEDISVWKEDRKGNFSVKWDYSSLCAESRVDFPTKDIWGSQAPMRLDFFTWEAPWGKILTIELLVKTWEGGGCWLIHAVDVKRVKNLLTLFWFTVRARKCYGCYFYNFLVRNGCF